MNKKNLPKLIKMKKVILNIQKTAAQLIVLIIVLFGGVVMGQYPYEYSFSGIPLNTKTIVRAYDQNRVVVYYEEGGRGYVSLVNVVSYDGFKVPLDVGFFMNDMCIMNDSVFLCGGESYLNTSYGSIVAMSLASFYTSTVQVTYYRPSYWMYMNFKRIKCFPYSDGIHNFGKFLLVCDVDYPCDGTFPFPLNTFPYHDYYIDTNNHSTCTVNAVMEVTYPLSTIFLQVLRVMPPIVHSEAIHDVVVTDNYVAFVGVETGSSDAITLHICNQGNNVLWSVYPNVHYFDDYYSYSLGTSGGNPFYHACALDGDRIAIVTQDETSLNSNIITVRTFDLASHTMINTQYLQCYSHPDLKDVTYIPELKRLVLLYSGYFRSTGSYCDIFCTVDPYNVNPLYVLPGITDDVFHTKFGSLDAMNNRYFISTGGKYGFVSDVGSFIVGRNCYKAENYDIVNMRVVDATEHSFNYDQYRAIAAKWQTDEVPVHITIPPQCIDNL